MAKKEKSSPRKKGNAKDRKLEQNAKRLEKIQAAEARKQAEEALLKEEEARKENERRLKRLRKIEADDPDCAKILKSKAKAAGVKSIFTLRNERLLVTSFANGNNARRDKYVEDGSVTNITDESVLTVIPDEEAKKFNVSGRIIKDAKPDDPRLSGKKAGEDLVYLKEKHEKVFFGKTFEDNIHIQVAYNVLDISKILSVFANNIVYEMNNMLRSTGQENDDVIGSIGFKISYEKFENLKNSTKKKEKDRYDSFGKLLSQPQLGYFGNTLLFLDEKGKRVKKEENEEKWEEHRKHCYYLLATLAMVRQATAHGDLEQRSMIYRLEDDPDGDDETSVCIRNAGKELDKIYSERVKNLNSKFFETSGEKDLAILFRALGADTDKAKQHIAQEYYRFIVLKEHKNLGFSIKRLREVMISQDAGQLADEEYDTFRHKLNHLVDFLICQYYKKQENDERCNALVEKLRSSANGSEKTLIYMDEAKVVWQEIEYQVNTYILPKMTKEGIGSISKVSMEPSVLNSVAVSENAHRFTKMIYLMTLFLDGKEINDLLTQLINRFDNIRSFLDVMKQENIEYEFTEQYKLLHDSAAIVEELRVLNSFARMSREDLNAKVEMFIEAAEVLGYPDSEESLREYAKDVFDQKTGLKRANGRKDNGFRNFIINNVINSGRFKYLIRYGNPKRVRSLVTNKVVVAFVLKNIPDEQIRLYYNSCNDVKKSYFPEMRDDLAEKIQNFSFEDFKFLSENSSESDDDAWEKDKELKKNMVRLYLTVLYLLQKNLVYVNSRYYMAFHCAERDAIVCDADKYKSILKSDRAAYARDFLEQHPNRSRYYLAQNFENADKKSWNYFRNCVEHLNVVRDAYLYIEDIREFKSYFELYHYLVQRYIIDKFGDNTPGGKLPVYFEKVKKYKTFCKDFVKALNMPFAYNLPRYKNLSINELFDRNHYLEDRKKMYEELKNDD